MTTKKITVCLAQIVRQEKYIVVEVPEDFNSWEEKKFEDMLDDLYDLDDGIGYFNDEQWGAEKGTNSVVNSDEVPIEPAEFKVSLNEHGMDVERVKGE